MEVDLEREAVQNCEIQKILEHRISDIGAFEFKVQYKQRRGRKKIPDAWIPETDDDIEACQELLERYMVEKGLMVGIKRLNMRKGEATEEITRKSYIAEWLEKNAKLGYNSVLVEEVANDLYNYYEILTEETPGFYMSAPDMVNNYQQILDDIIKRMPFDDDKDLENFKDKFEIEDIPIELEDELEVKRAIEGGAELTDEQAELAKKLLNIPVEAPLVDLKADEKAVLAKILGLEQGLEIVDGYLNQYDEERVETFLAEDDENRRIPDMTEAELEEFYGDDIEERLEAAQEWLEEYSAKDAKNALHILELNNDLVERITNVVEYNESEFAVDVRTSLLDALDVFGLELLELKAERVNEYSFSQFVRLYQALAAKPDADPNVKTGYTELKKLLSNKSLPFLQMYKDDAVAETAVTEKKKQKKSRKSQKVTAKVASAPPAATGIRVQPPRATKAPVRR